MDVPVINIGIMTGKEVLFAFNEEYVHTQSGDFLIGEQRALFVNGNILFNKKLYKELFFEPSTPAASFDLKGVTIGVDFHWQRKEDQRFQGALNLVVDEDSVLVINQVEIENYLTSVISSEMSATASAEFLKAHAVISRSWLIAQVTKKHDTVSSNYTIPDTPHERIRWYDREDHAMFDVCADDHCQRYQGITRASSPLVREAIQATYGEVLVFDGEVCDARFSKCCGGVTEKFEQVWEPVPHAYLTSLRDSAQPEYPDLSIESEAANWIRTSPEAFCNTTDKEILSQVLNNYDQETTDFYRWKVVYTQKEIAGLINGKSGMDFGDILDLIPVKRGASGRIEKLRIVGSKQSFTIGKELEIRRILSETHLYSSAFTIDKEDVVKDIPQRFTLTGSGWGHGVGLCQIGAAVMGEKGHSYQQILAHYYPETEIKKQY